MRRVRNWDCLAVEWAIQQVGKPFVWGETDCASLLTGMLGVMYRKLPPLPRYASLRDAMDIWEQTGGVKPVLLEWGSQPLPTVAYANTGDVLIASPRDDEPFDAVMPVITDKYLFTEPNNTVQLIPLANVPVDAVPYRVPHVW